MLKIGAGFDSGKGHFSSKFRGRVQGGLNSNS